MYSVYFPAWPSYHWVSNTPSAADEFHLEMREEKKMKKKQRERERGRERQKIVKTGKNR